MKIIHYFILFVVMGLLSCSRVFMPYELFHIDKNISLSDPDQLLETKPYILRTGDVISVTIFPNKGLELISPFQQQSAHLSENFKVTVERDGCVDFPALGRIQVAGKTLELLRQQLSELYAGIISDPYIQAAVTHHTVTVFTGGRNSGKSLTFQVPEASVIEVIALAGGINMGKAREIYLIRNEDSQPKIYKLDLSKAQHVKYAYAPVYSGDIILVRSQSNTYRIVIENILPYMNIITTILLIMNLLK